MDARHRGVFANHPPQLPPDTQVSGYLKTKPAEAGSLKRFSAAAVHFIGHGLAAARRLNVWRFWRRGRWYALLILLLTVGCSPILSRRAQLYSLAERHDDAIIDLTAALELDPDNPELYTLRGQMYLALYEWDAALADYNAALELAPDYADAYYYRGVLYASILQTGLETRDDALADFRRYLELAPDGDHAAEAAQAIADLEAAQDALDG